MATKALTLTDTTIGRKMVMAVTGIILFGFVIGHMAGHLQMFLGPTAYNEYAHFLQSTKGLLWGTRTVLLLAVVAHIGSALQLTLANNAARPVRYRMKKHTATSYAARTMVWSGPILALFIVYHILHFTVGYTMGLGYEHSPPDANGLPNVYQNMVMSFRVPWCVGAYTVAMLALGLHLYHGAWSLMQSLGLNHKRYNETVRSAASAVAIATVVGFLSVPIGIYLGWIS